MVGWESGATGFIHISTAESDEEQRIEITGTGGRMRLTKGRLEVLRNDVDMRDYAVSPGNPYEAPPTLDLETVDGTGGKHAEIYRDLVAARAEGRPPIAPGSSALQTLELTNALTYSAHTRQRGPAAARSGRLQRAAAVIASRQRRAPVRGACPQRLAM